MLTAPHNRIRCTALFLLLAVAACARRSEPLVIGLAGPFSEQRGESMRLAAELAVQEVNAAGGVRGRALQLLVKDDSARPDRAVTVAAALRDDPRVVAVIGHLTSGTTIPAAAVYDAGDDPVVNISPSASAAEVAGIGAYTFRLCADDQLHGVVLARWLYSRLAVHAVAAVYQNDDYGRGVLATFAAEYARLGGTIVERDPFLATTSDFRPYLERIKAQGRARGLFVAGVRSASGTLLRQARALGLAFPVVGADALTGIQSEGAVAESVFVTSNWLPDLAAPTSRAFVGAYAAAYGSRVPDHRGAGAYDAVHLIADAIRARGTSRHDVREGLVRLGRDLPAYAGVTGRITFDAKGDVPGKTVLVGVVRNGRLVLAGGQ